MPVQDIERGGFGVVTAMGQHERHVGMLGRDAVELGQLGVVGPAVLGSAEMDDDGQPAIGGESEHRPKAFVVEAEPADRAVQLEHA
jgi:hypothetical protein